MSAAQFVAWFVAAPFIGACVLVALYSAATGVVALVAALLRKMYRS